MTFISYAQNWEDVFLNRIFGGIGTGFYVDVGAFDPVVDSVTKALYDRGWSGINIEPGGVFDVLMDARQRDVNLRMAVLDRTGNVPFIENERAGGLSRIVDRDCHSEDQHTVPCDTLENIIERYGDNRLIDFIKIDVEGAEQAIISSTNWRKIRPKLLIVESTHPMTNKLVNGGWEPLLVDSGYKRVYFDGINCFYVSDEHVDAIAHHFAVPINVLDNALAFDPVKEQELIHWRAISESMQKERDELWEKFVTAQAEFQNKIESCERARTLLQEDIAAARAERDGSKREAAQIRATREAAQEQFNLLERELRMELAGAKSAIQERQEEWGKLEDRLRSELASMQIEHGAVVAAHQQAERRLRSELSDVLQYTNGLKEQLRRVQKQVQHEQNLSREIFDRDNIRRVDQDDLLRIAVVSAERMAVMQRKANGTARYIPFFRRRRIPIGHVDHLRDGLVTGWVFDRSGTGPCTVKAIINGIVIGVAAASTFRQDLAEAGHGDGRYGFSLVLGDHPVLHNRTELLQLRIEAQTERPFLLAVFYIPPGEGAPPKPFRAPSASEQQAHVPCPRGHVDHLIDGVVAGWVYGGHTGARPCTVKALVNGTVVGLAMASTYRQQLADAGYGDGHYGFSLVLEDHPVLHDRTELLQLRIEAQTEPPFLLATYYIPPGAGAPPKPFRIRTAKTCPSECPPSPLEVLPDAPIGSLPVAESKDRAEIVTLPPTGRRALSILERRLSAEDRY